MKKKLFPILMIVLCLLLSASPVFASSYSFSVNTAKIDAYFNQDGTLTLEYEYVFSNNPGAAPIDFIDLGLPNNNYDIKTVSAWLNDQPITDISKADPENLMDGDSGITLALASSAIQPGQTGDVRIHIGTIRKVIYPYTDDDKKDYASVNIIPNWFNGDFVTGNTAYTVTLHLPPGIQPDEPYYYIPQNWPGSSDPESGYDAEGNVFYRWTATGSVASKYTFGAAFPAKYVPKESIVTAPAITINPGEILCWLIGLIIFGIFCLSVYQGIWGAKKRKLEYLPPKISIEGHGIKRGLTAVEVAVLMEQSVDKILTMILFGVIKKRAAEVVTRDPLEIKVADPLPDGLQPYEIEFLSAFKQTGKDRKKALQELFINLVKTVGEKMKGFSQKETLNYYKDINEKAWQQIQAADTPEVKSQLWDQSFEWTMLDKDFPQQSQRVFGGGPVYVPMWWGAYDPDYRHASTLSTSSTSSSSGGSGHNTTTISLPHLPGSDFAASVVGGVQAFSASVIGDVTSFTNSITNKTNPVPSTSSNTWRSSGGGGGGHSCACACACAGCACACAGGGR